VAPSATSILHTCIVGFGIGLGILRNSVRELVDVNISWWGWHKPRNLPCHSGAGYHRDVGQSPIPTVGKYVQNDGAARCGLQEPVLNFLFSEPVLVFMLST